MMGLSDDWSVTVDVKLVNVPAVEVGQARGDRWETSKTSVVFEVRDGDLRGRLQVSTGGLRWWRGGVKNPPQDVVPWDDFIAAIEKISNS